MEPTDDYSFAYLKELVLSAMMQWAGDRRPGAMDEIILRRAALLRDQMKSVSDKKLKKRKEKDKFKKAAGRL